MQRASASRPQRELSIIVTLAVIIATPATLALSYYNITGDPTFRPLAQTVERLVARGITVDAIDVQALVTTDGTADGLRHSQELGKKLRSAFYGKGLAAHALVHSQPIAGPAKIVFRVSGLQLGPFTERNAAHGVQVAAEAVKMLQARRATDLKEP